MAIAVGVVLVVGSTTACHFGDVVSTGRTEDPEESARLLKSLERDYRHRPWIRLVRDARYVREGFASFDAAIVLTTIDASDGISLEEAEDASDICRAAVSVDLGDESWRFHAWTGRVKAADGTLLKECSAADSWTVPQTSPTPISTTPA